MLQGELRSDEILSVDKQWRPRGNIFKVDEAKGSPASIFLRKCAQLTPKREIKIVFL